MNKNKFETLCEGVLIPKIDETVKRRVKPIRQMLDIMARALAHIERKIDGIESSVKRRE
jgi:hypothetical protein